MNTNGIGIPPDDWGFATPGNRRSPPPPLYAQGPGVGGSPGHGIQLQ